MAQQRWWQWWVDLFTQLSPRIEEGFKTRWSKESLTGIAVVFVGAVGWTEWISGDQVIQIFVIAIGFITTWRRNREAKEQNTVSRRAQESARGN